MNRIDVFVSSTSLDLPLHREKVRNAIDRAKMRPVMMEHLSASLRDPVAVSLGMVEEAEIYVGIFGYRYGYCPDPDGPSITEMEYRRAVELGMPILIFMMSDKHPGPNTSGLNALETQEVMAAFYESSPTGREKLDKLKTELKRRTVGFFDSEEDLMVKVLQALREDPTREAAEAYLARRTAVSAPPPPPPPSLPDSAPATSLPIPPALYAKPPYSGGSQRFVGRRDELAALDAWAAADSTAGSVMVVEAIGGMGKSALAWKWIQDRAVPVDRAFDGVFWYSFYEGGADMRECVRHALAYVTRRDPDALIGGKLADHMRDLTAVLRRERHLLILDGLERLLVAYHRWDAAQMADDSVQDEAAYRACTVPDDADALAALADVGASRVLITSRLFPDALTEAGTRLKGVVEFTLHGETGLRGLSPTDARALWRDLGIRWTDGDEAALDTVFNGIGRHGLLLKLVAGVINRAGRAKGDFRKWFAVTEGKTIDFTGKDVKARRHHILEEAFRDLAPEARALLGQIAVFGTAVSFDTLNVFNPFTAAMGENAAIERLETLLMTLESRGLIWFEADKELYDLHPVVRGFMYAAMQPDERRAHHARAYDLFAGQERALNSDDARTLADLHIPIAMVLALVGAGRLDDAASLYATRLRDPLTRTIGLYQRAYELLLPLFPDGLDHPPALSDPGVQAARASDMGIVLSYLGRDEEALMLNTVVVRLKLDQRDIRNLAAALGNYGVSLAALNRLAAARAVYETARALADVAVPDTLWGSHIDLQSVYTALGWWTEADAAYQAFMADPPRQQTDTWKASVERIYAESLWMRGAPAPAIAAAIAAAQGYAQAGRNMLQARILHGLRGEVALDGGDPTAAVEHFNRAIEMGQQAGVRNAGYFGGLARALWRLADARPAEAARLRARALRIVGERVDSYSAAVVLHADGQTEAARERAIRRYTWAWADGEPYVRRFYLDQAAALLTVMGVPPPELPPYDESKARWEHEDAMTAYIAALRARKADADP